MAVSNGNQVLVYNGGGVGMWCRDLTEGFVYPVGINPLNNQYAIHDDVGDLVEIFHARMNSVTFITLKEGDRLLRYSGSVEEEQWNSELTVGKIYILNDNHIIDDVFDPVCINEIRTDDFTEVEL